jgi:hypothetical protein
MRHGSLLPFEQLEHGHAWSGGTQAPRPQESTVIVSRFHSNAAEKLAHRTACCNPLALCRNPLAR